LSVTKKQAQEPIAIIGMGCRFPMADSPSEFWANTLNGKDCISDIPKSHWSVEDYYAADPKAPDMTYAKRGGFINRVAFDPMKYSIPPSALEATDTSQLLGLVVAHEALIDAGYGRDAEFDRNRVSVVLGVTGALELVIPLGARLGHPIWRKALLEAGIEAERAEAIVAKIASGYVPWQENSFPGLLGNVVAGRIANGLDLGGTNCVVDAACASSLSAIHLACLELQAGRSDMAITGGIDTFNDIFMYMCFSKTPALSPTGNASPFDAMGDGTILGEGLGAVVLKRLSDAKRDGDSIYAVIRGLGSSSDGKGNAIYAPSAEGQVKALRRAYELADVDPKTVGLVEGHGTGTKVGDAIEASALSEVYGQSDDAPWCALGSVKSQIGHTKAAAGVAGLMKAALALHRKVLPPSIKVTRPLDVLSKPGSPIYLNTQARPWAQSPDHPRRAAASAFGFGGSNFHCVLEEFGTKKPCVDWDGNVQILAFSGPDQASLKQQLNGWNPKGSWRDTEHFAAESRAKFKVGDAVRLLVLLERGKTQLEKIRDNALSLLDRYADQNHWSAPEGIVFGRGASAGKLGVLFPGQGSQYVGMLRDLACRFPQFQDVLEELDAVAPDLAEQTGHLRFSDLIYPPAAFETEEEQRQSQRLTHTQIAQPAIGAVSIGALEVARSFGISPEAVAGHSFGEITALCASGRFNEDAFYLLSKLRGRLMAMGSGDKGAMLAVRASQEKLETLLEDHRIDLVMANKNAPDQTVLSGATAEIDRAMGVLDQHKIRHKRLPVAAAFHSGLVGQAREPFYAELSKLEFPKAKIPVYANATAEIYPDDPVEAKELLANQLLQPVEFVEEIESMYEDGVRTFLEVGPGARLTGLVKSILNGRDFEALAMDASSGKRSGMWDLARVLAQLAAHGFDIDLRAWEAGGPNKEPLTGKQKMTVWLTGSNYKSPQTLEKAKKPLPPQPKREQPRPVSRKPQTVSATTLPNQEQTPITLKPNARQAPPEATTPMAPGQMQDALSLSQKHIDMLQRIQAQTAALHQQFLEGQAQTQRNLGALIQQQRQELFRGGAPERPVTQAPKPKVEPERIFEAPAAKNANTPQGPEAIPPKRVPPENRGAKVEKVLLKILAEKTGYPEEMLELDMQLDADLGVDSIKRVEILSALQEALPQLQPVAPDEVVRLQSLRDIVELLNQPVVVERPVAETAVPDANTGQKVLFEVVAEKTGYPVDMLEAGMSLDADLGIDSIKCVEILSALQAAMPGAPEFKPEDMGTIQTLADILAKLGSTVTSSPSPVPKQAVESTDSIQQALVGVVSEKTGYPEYMLEMSMSLDADLGIDSIKRVEILSALQDAMPALPTVAPDDIARMHTLGDIVDHLAGQPVSPSMPDVAPGKTSAESKSVLLGIIAEKTGYPEDMLEAGMSLEADLGIDSIKRVEILSSLSESLPELPEIKADRVADFQTIGDIVAFLGAGPVESAAKDDGSLWSLLQQIVAEKTGYPADMLEESMGLEADLGIDSIKRVEILSALQDAKPGIPVPEGDQIGQLQTLGDIQEFFAGMAKPQPELGSTAPKPQPVTPVEKSDTPAPVFAYRLHTVPFKAEKSVVLGKGATIWLTSAKSPWGQALCEVLSHAGYAVFGVPETMADQDSWPEPAGLILLAPQTWDADFAKHALFVTQAAGPSLIQHRESSGSFLASMSWLGGRFGLDSSGPDMQPQSGALSGLVKTASLEWPTVHCRALDLNLSDNGSRSVNLAVQGLLAKGPVELGITAEGFEALESIPVEDRGDASLPLSEKDVVLVTGGARGVTAACVQALSQKLPLRFVLLGRSPQPQPEPEWLANLGSESEIRKAILQRSETKLSPRELAEKSQNILKAREIRENLDRLKAAGADVLYRQVDVCDSEALQAVVAEVRETWGGIQGLIHGAGVLADKLILDKTPEQFEKVWRTKVIAMETLLAALADETLKIVAMFSSSTARFGRVGQVDYAMANEVLNKTGAAIRLERPECRVASLNWGPWAGGMVTPELEKVFAAEGVALIPLETGAETFVKSLSRPVEDALEWVVLGGPMPEKEPDVDEDAMHAVFERSFALDQLPFLRGHAMNDQGVLPMAMMLEWMAHTAITNHPGLHFQGVDQLRVYKAITLKPGEKITLRFMAGKAEKGQGVFRIPVALRSGPEQKITRHAKAVVVLGNSLASQGKPSLAGPEEAYTKSPAEIYQMLFHRKPFQAIQAVNTYSDEGLTAVAAGAPEPKAWMAKPLRSKWLSDPLLIDAGFQLMVLWCIERYGIPSLPTYFGQFRQFGPMPAGKDVGVTVRIKDVVHQKVTADIEFVSREDGRLLGRVSGYECVMDGSLNQAFRRNRLHEEALKA